MQGFSRHEMDGLSAAASVIAVIQISLQVYDLCQSYHSGVKNAREDIEHLSNEVWSLKGILTNLKDLAENPGSTNQSKLDSLTQQNGPLQQCQKDLDELVTKLSDAKGKNNMRKWGFRALKWPFSSKDVEKLLETIGRHKETFSLALTVDIKAELRNFHDNEHWQKIRRWLSPPDPSSNYNTARDSYQPTTGDWFLGSKEFREWRAKSNSFLWLYGIRRHIFSVLFTYAGG